MASIGSGVIPIAGANNVRLSNLSLPTPNSEVSFSLVDSLKAFEIKNRNPFDVKFSFVSGESGTTFFTIPKHSAYAKDNVTFTGKSIYFQSSGSSVLEILEFY